MAWNPNTMTSQPLGGLVCMAGSIVFEKDRGKWAVSWYWKGKPKMVRRYKGEFMYHEKIAQKCLAMIQGRYEQYQQGLCTFRIEEFTGKNWTDVDDFFKEWMKEVVEPNKKPGTIKGYWSYWRNWLGPFFKKHPILLHEIQLDTLIKLKNSIKNSGKGQYNVMNCLHSLMDHAFRSNRIPSIPPFPKKSDYDLKAPDFKWVTEDIQMGIINAIPKIHRPIFLWLKYHYRRPSEACALTWLDYDVINQVFTIRRTFSARILVESTKTREIHHIPCDEDFLHVIQQLRKNRIIKLDEFIFQNPRARKPGKSYQIESLNKLWHKACGKVGVAISLYEGLKHSSCSQFINEHDGTIDELQMLTDHARRDSVAHYAKVGMGRKKKLMARRRVVDLKKNINE